MPKGVAEITRAIAMLEERLSALGRSL